jgi:seryl-tRNA synthetase
MLDIEFVRFHPQAVKKSLKKRMDKHLLVEFDGLIKKDDEWRKLKQQNDVLRQERNTITKKITEAKQQGRGTNELIKAAQNLPNKLKENDEKTRTLRTELDLLLKKMPNVLDDSVPMGKTDKDSKVIGKWGVAKANKKLQHHGELAVALGLADFERGVKIAGAGFYFLKNELALMDMGLQRLAIDYLVKKGFTPLSVPFLMRRAPYEGVTSLDDFEKVMYKIEGSDHYLIATSEHPLAAMHMNEILPESELPLKLAGMSTCFRQEIGKHGLDERGLFRVHQFNKIEQFVFCKPEDAEKFHEQLLAHSEWLLKKLKLPYRVVNVASGDMGVVAAKKYDVETYSPRENKFIETMSCSNCTDYQTNALNIKYRKAGSMEKGKVYTLNNTMIATSRILRIILEHYQTPKGTLKIPAALQPYVGGKKEIGLKK